MRDSETDGAHLPPVRRQRPRKDRNRPYQVKRVLEDGLLGSSFLFSEMTGKRAPQLEGLNGAFGEDPC